MQGSRQKLLNNPFPARSTSVVDSGCRVLGFVSMPRTAVGDVCLAS